MLFNKRLLQTNLNSFEFPQGFDFERTEKIIHTWQESIKNGNYDKTKETQVQSAFLTKFFNTILGYTEMHDNSSDWCLVNEAKTDIDSTRADGALGFFNGSENITRAVIELKDAKTPLDKKQSSRKDYDSPVSQAFSYSSKFDGCDWIIVSNFKEIRIYHKDRGQGYFESFEVLNLNDKKEFKRFYFMLCKQNLIDRNRNSLLDKLVKDTSKNEEDISKKFYKDFKGLRQELFIHFCEHNPNIDKKCLLEKTQKFLDRLVFIMFCEDSGVGLLPMNTLKNYYDTGKNLPIPSDDKIWQIIKGLFHSIDKGNNDVKPPINKYNGGLFATDELLDNLVIKDSAWQGVINLANYDFESDLNVNILGHIFEQSLSDLEQIKAEIDGVEQDKTKSKRKKDGIFYTPEYITRYIVEQTIGKYLDENPDKLETIKILDPACGSGAFINQAHTFLKEQYQIRTEERIDSEKARKRGGQEFVALDLFKHVNVAETDRSILLNNLYGVDLNEESTEITKLALWLKTAKKDQPLQNLDNNIKCGNSLIDDATIAGDKAFNWNEEFKDIMDNGGFDCIIGNPPYVNAKNGNFKENEKTFLNNSYETAEYQLDTYLLFIEKSINLLKTNGILGFIIPNPILNNLFICKIREFLLKNTHILEIVESTNQIFEDANVDTIVLIVKKISNEKNKEIKIGQFNDAQYIFKHYSNQELFEANSNFVFSVNLSKNATEIIKKIECKSIKTSEVLEISTGIKEYQVGKGTPAQVQADKDSSHFNANFKKNETFIPELRGKNINRYSLCWGNEYVSYGKWIAEPRNPKFFDGERVLLRKIPGVKNLILTALTEKFIIDQSLYIGKLDNKNYLLNFVLAILSSKLTGWYFKNINNEFDDLFPQIKINQFKDLPILIATQEQQTSLASKAEQMIELNKQLHESVKSALDLLQAEYQPKKISQKLEKFYTLGIHPFLEELAKQGVKLSLSQKEELLTWYKQKSDTLNNIKNQIDTLDRSIDVEVYKLYNLTEDEIKIIEES